MMVYIICAYQSVITVYIWTWISVISSNFV